MKSKESALRMAERRFDHNKAKIFSVRRKQVSNKFYIFATSNTCFAQRGAWATKNRKSNKLWQIITAIN